MKLICLLVGLVALFGATACEEEHEHHQGPYGEPTTITFGDGAMIMTETATIINNGYQYHY
jgi:hypothetical protein